MNLLPQKFFLQQSMVKPHNELVIPVFGLGLLG